MEGLVGGGTSRKSLQECVKHYESDVVMPVNQVCPCHSQLR